MLLRIALIGLAFAMAALNFSWFYHQRLWSRLVSAVFWLLLIVLAVGRQSWPVPILGLLFATNVALRIHERRSGKLARATARSLEEIMGPAYSSSSAASPPALPESEFSPATSALEANLSLPEARPLRCVDGVTTTLPAGEHAWQIRLQETADDNDEAFPDEEDEPPEMGLRCTATNSGQTLVFTRDPARLIDLESCAGDGSRTLMSWAAAPENVREIFARRCLIAGVETNEDSRIYFPLRLDDREFVIHTKYLTWASDLALSADGRRIWVRVSELTAEKWSGNFFDEKERGKFVGDETVPAFCFEIPVERLLPDDEDE